MEYLLITGLVFLMIVPMIVLFITKNIEFNEDISTAQANKVVESLVIAADSVYFQGMPSQQTLKIYMPKYVQNINISNQQIIFQVAVGESQYTMHGITKANLTGNISTTAGLHVIEVIAQQNNVLIQE